MNDALPSYKNIFELLPDEITKIEKKCIEEGHLKENDKLLDHISNNLKLLDTLGLSKTDIYFNHYNMHWLFNKTDKFNKKSNNIMHNIQAYNLPKEWSKNWCCRHTDSNEIILNNQHLKISRFIWNGSEYCPIEQYFMGEDEGYRGDTDWFVTNLNTGKTMWIPDLVPVQIGMFGFSQTSEYKVNIEKYVEIMGLGYHVEKIKTIKEQVWDMRSSPFTFNETRYKRIFDEENDLYSAIQFYQIDPSTNEAWTGKLWMCIQPKMTYDDIFKENDYIEVFGKKLFKDPFCTFFLKSDIMMSFTLQTYTNIIDS